MLCPSHVRILCNEIVIVRQDCSVHFFFEKTLLIIQQVNQCYVSQNGKWVRQIVTTNCIISDALINLQNQTFRICYLCQHQQGIPLKLLHHLFSTAIKAKWLSPLTCKVTLKLCPIEPTAHLLTCVICPKARTAGMLCNGKHLLMNGSLETIKTQL